MWRWMTGVGTLPVLQYLLTCDLTVHNHDTQTQITERFISSFIFIST